MTQTVSDRAMKAAVSMGIHACCGTMTRDKAIEIEKYFPAYDDLIAALKTWLEEYIALVNSGDAGFWDPEKELKVIKTRELLLQVQS